MPPILPIERASDLRRFLEDRGYHFEDRPHQLFLAKGRDTVVNLYANGKVVIGGSRPEERAVVLGFLDSIGA